MTPQRSSKGGLAWLIAADVTLVAGLVLLQGGFQLVQVVVGGLGHVQRVDTQRIGIAGLVRQGTYRIPVAALHRRVHAQRHPSGTRLGPQCQRVLAAVVQLGRV